MDRLESFKTFTSICDDDFIFEHGMPDFVREDLFELQYVIEQISENKTIKGSPIDYQKASDDIKNKVYSTKYDPEDHKDIPTYEVDTSKKTSKSVKHFNDSDRHLKNYYKDGDREHLTKAMTSIFKTDNALGPGNYGRIAKIAHAAGDYKRRDEYLEKHHKTARHYSMLHKKKKIAS